jgi:uncharacterized protein (DUF1501 family)
MGAAQLQRVLSQLRLQPMREKLDTTRDRSVNGKLPRRDFVAMGALGAAGLVLNDSTIWAQSASGAATAGILLFLRGGPSHLDTFDLKPDASSEYRGEFKAIATVTPGISICEHLPRLAKCTDHFALIHGVSHALAAHSLGTEYVNTGTRPLASLTHPDYGAVVSQDHPAGRPVPTQVAMPQAEHGPGFLGTQYSPFVTGFPRSGAPQSVRGISLPPTLSLSEFDRRHALLRELDQRFESLSGKNKLVDALDAFNQQTYQIIRSVETRQAFDLSREDPSFSRRFGSDEWGAACLLAIRLVEAGVRFITLSLGGWDTHANNFPVLRDRLLPQLDVALAGLITGLRDRGLLTSTAVMATGEFGRTPRINKNPAPGRDHHPRCMTVLMAGGHIHGGQTVGASDATGNGPLHTPFSPDDVAASFYHNLGIDSKKVFTTEAGRPITLVRDGDIISQLFTGGS